MEHKIWPGFDSITKKIKIKELSLQTQSYRDFILRPIYKDFMHLTRTIFEEIDGIKMHHLPWTCSQEYHNLLVSLTNPK